MKRFGTVALLIAAVLCLAAYTTYIPQVATDRPVTTPSGTAPAGSATPTQRPTGTVSPTTAPTGTPTPTTAPTSTASPTTTPTSTPTTAPTPTPTPHWVDLVDDGGFEAGRASPYWSQYSRGGYSLIGMGAAAKSGTYGAILCSYDDAADSLSQRVSVPPGTLQATVALSFRMYSNDSLTSKHDLLRLSITDESHIELHSAEIASNTSTRETWLEWESGDLSQYGGQSIYLDFRCTTDSSNITIFFLDDITFMAKVP